MATVLPFDAAGIHLDPAQGLARQLYAALRERILDGRLGSRTRMPASRELAQALKVSRNTVVRAYEQLHAEGLRGEGIGRRLIEHVYAEAGAAGCSRVHWLTHESNSDAMKLYERIADKSGFLQYRRIL